MQLGGGGTLYRLAVKLDTKDPDVKLAPSTLATYENAFAWPGPLVCSNFRLFPCVSEDADGAELSFEYAETTTGASETDSADAGGR